MRTPSLIGSLVLALGIALAGTGSAADPTAQSFVKDRQTELASLVKNGSQPGTKKRIETVFDTILDYDALAQGSLRDHWDGRSEAERREFQEILKQLVQRAYRKNLDRTVSYEIRFDGESKEGEAFVVRTVAQSRTNAREEPISIDYVVHRASGTWLIQDIVTEGSSLVGTYRQQFGRIIKKDGFPELLKRMRNKLSAAPS